MVIQVAVVIVLWLIEIFRLVVLMLAFEHHICAHMVPLVPSYGRHVSVLSLL